MDMFIGFAFGLFMMASLASTTITEEGFAKGQEVCRVNGGLDKYISEFLGNPHVTCKNGAKFQLKDSE